jgi:hypothetical protein
MTKKSERKQSKKRKKPKHDAARLRRERGGDWLARQVITKEHV